MFLQFCFAKKEMMEEDAKNCDVIKQTNEVKCKSFSIDSLLSNDDVNKKSTCNNSSSIIYSSNSPFTSNSDGFVQFRMRNNFGECDASLNGDGNLIGDRDVNQTTLLRNLTRNSLEKRDIEQNFTTIHDDFGRFNGTQHKEQHEDVSTSEEMCERNCNEGRSSLFKYSNLLTIF